MLCIGKIFQDYCISSKMALLIVHLSQAAGECANWSLVFFANTAKVIGAVAETLLLSVLLTIIL